MEKAPEAGLFLFALLQVDELVVERQVVAAASRRSETGSP
jgi:hypothetical protein